jgi:hypothetical protein
MNDDMMELVAEELDSLVDILSRVSFDTSVDPMIGIDDTEDEDEQEMDAESDGMT